MMEKLPQSSGKAYWRSLEELAESPEFTRFLEAEFPSVADEAKGGNVSRRRFLGLMGASMALAGLAGCRRPVEKIIPYVAQPEEVIPGVASYYATTMPWGLSPLGLLIESHEGRPTKIEGNPQHPATRGKSSAFAQSELLALYDPDRSRQVLNNGAESSWADFVSFWRDRFASFVENDGRGLAVLTEPFSSPTLARLRDDFIKEFPRAHFVALDPISDDGAVAGGRFLSGNNNILYPEYRYDTAKVILALDADLFVTETDAIANARRFADGRRITDDHDSMSRFYVVEPDFTTAGGMADHRLRVNRGMIGAFVAALGWKLNQLGADIPGFDFQSDPNQEYGFDEKWLSVAARDLMDHRGSSLLVVGRSQGDIVHQMVAQINAGLNNIGKTVVYRRLPDAQVSDRTAMMQLVSDMNQGNVETLVIIGGNPVYSSSGEYGFGEAMKKVPTTVHLSSYVDETSAVVTWHIPRAHFLEHWGDARAVDGSRSIVQPLIAPLFNGKSDVEVLDILSHGRDRRGYEIIRETWQTMLPSDSFEKEWRTIVHDGIKSNDSPDPVRLSVRREASFTRPQVRKPENNQVEVCFVPSHATYDGRYANIGWMQELPHPVSKLTWDSAACMSNLTAKKLGISNGDLVSLDLGGKNVELPAWIVPGIAENSLIVPLGYGRTRAGHVGDAVGVDLYPYRKGDALNVLMNVSVVKTGQTYPLASTQDHGAMEGRAIVREAPLDYYKEHPDFARRMVEHPELKSIYGEYDYSKGYQWGMAIDLTSCVGCNACTIACQSENNIPVVGKDRVMNGREMHWIRLDRYYTGDSENPEMVFQPLTCQHCETAPCEAVCPVAATVHDNEGLNVMAYNRCIGTRYCSNNCPYKVRRFNFFNYNKNIPEVVQMAKNPDVTVRFRGVMEKCTFCTQRINKAKITAKLEDRTVTDKDLQTACQQACPADAIKFGNINDPESAVAKARKSHRAYELLAEFNTRPRNSFLARIRNPHPDLAEPFELKIHDDHSKKDTESGESHH